MIEHNSEIVLIFFALIIFFIFITIIYIAAYWKLFSKAGQSGWKILIPVFNIYIIITKIAKKSPIFFWIPFSGILSLLFFTSIIEYLFHINSSTYMPFSAIAATLGSVIYIGCIALFIIINLKISENFGHSSMFAVGLIFLNLIFLLILAFGKSKFKFSGNNDEFETEEYECIDIDYKHIETENNDE